MSYWEESLQAFKTCLLQSGYPEPTAITRDTGYALGDHSHPFDACALITHGQITLIVDGVERTYCAGEVFELARNTAHSEFAGPAGVSYLAGRRQ